MKMKNYLLLHNQDFKAIPSRASGDADVINKEHLNQVSGAVQSKSWQSTNQRSCTPHCAVQFTASTKRIEVYLHFVLTVRGSVRLGLDTPPLLHSTQLITDKYRATTCRIVTTAAGVGPPVSYAHTFSSAEPQHVPD